MQRREGRLRRDLWCTSLQLRNCKVRLLVYCVCGCPLGWDGSMGSTKCAAALLRAAQQQRPVHLHPHLSQAPYLPRCRRWYHSSASLSPAPSTLWTLSASSQHDLSTWLCWQEHHPSTSFCCHLLHKLDF